MTTSRALKRLLRVLDIEEETRRRELERAQGSLTQLELSLAVSAEREKKGRRLLVSSANSANLDDRLAGLEEMKAGKRQISFLEGRIEQSASVVGERRAALREKQVERKQAETLVSAAAARQTVAEGRKAQQTLDEWFLTRIPSEKLKEDGREQEGQELRSESAESDLSLSTSSHAEGSDPEEAN